METTFRILGVGLNAAGALILAWRVKGIMDALIDAQHVNDLNFRLLVDIQNGHPQDLPVTVGMSEQVARKQRRGIALLVAGFVSIGVGSVLSGLAWLVP